MSEKVKEINKVDEDNDGENDSFQDEQFDENYKHTSIVKRENLQNLMNYFSKANEFYMKRPEYGNLNSLPIDIVDKAKIKLVELKI